MGGVKCNSRRRRGNNWFKVMSDACERVTSSRPSTKTSVHCDRSPLRKVSSMARCNEDALSDREALSPLVHQRLMPRLKDNMYHL